MTTTLWIALGAIAAALIARGVKISEFRQAWIEGLRRDISKYVSKAHEWIDLYLQINPELDQNKKRSLVQQLDRVKYESFRILRRIELRFKPDDESGNQLVGLLKDLLDPDKLNEPNQQSQWTQLADSAVRHARVLLKEEWEITKNPFRKLLGYWQRLMETKPVRKLIELWRRTRNLTNGST